MNRRNFLTGAGAAVATGIGGRLAADWNEWGYRSSVFIAKADSYEADLERHDRRRARASSGWAALGPGARPVLLKPNLVEPSREAPQINTHPSVVRAAAEVFRSWGRREVFVAEGPGHCRDALLVLDQSGLGDDLDEVAAGVRRPQP